ncbi:hypothetical protein [Microcoleus sp. herbarium12]
MDTLDVCKTIAIELAVANAESPGKKHPVLPIGVFLPGFYPAVRLADI